LTHCYLDLKEEKKLRISQIRKVRRKPGHKRGTIEREGDYMKQHIIVILGLI
jgi:hypothetical protein